ncbi:hypothetical protein GGI23_000236 [Coemansia sp. RSA 2559]|nr:hypothetical protein GGI23_000236 [Coemansia sp. RSA 2559]KAJ2869589.1 hypothetical protein GGI22_000152 [Coemansia erecta]
MHFRVLLVLLEAAVLAWAVDSDYMMQFRMAVLNKNGKQTSCMVAIMNMEAGFVAANCIDLMSDNSINKTSTYKVQFTPTGQSNTGFEVDLATSNITIHPYYDPKTLANNIAIVQYTNTSDAYKAYIGQQKTNGSSQIYTRRAINGTSNGWNNPPVYTQLLDDSDCTAGSPLYAANQQWLSCTSSVTTSVEDGQCSIPYGIIYTAENNGDAVVTSNLYSYSVVYGSSLCDSSAKTLSYYTSLYSYLGFAHSVVGWPIDIYFSGYTTWEGNTVLSMNTPGDTSVSGAIIVGGDLYQVEKDMMDSSYTPSESATASDEISQQPTHDTASSNSGSGLSKGAKIAIGVAVPIGAIIIAIGTAILIHIWRIKQQDKAWDPNAQASNLQEIALEMTVDDPYSNPPAYSPNDATRDGEYTQIEEPAMPKKM